jgi:purine nucleoside permease
MCCSSCPPRCWPPAAPTATRRSPLGTRGGADADSGQAVVVTMFEIGEDSGDQAAEFQLWNERRNLDTVFAFPAFHDLHFDSENGVLVMVTGIGTARSTGSVMMLGMDPRFDLSKAYWLVAGIAGIDPEDASIGSAAWAEYLVDGDLAHEIDPREMPGDWKYGYLARYTDEPFDADRPAPTGEMFRTNPELTEWAYQLTKDMELPDFESLDETRALYTEHPNAQRPPFVLKGDHLAAMTFWHGEILNSWANDWVDYWSDGNGEFVTSAMEDTGTMQALTWLTRAGPRRSRSPAGAAHGQQLHDATARGRRGDQPAGGERRLCRARCLPGVGFPGRIEGDRHAGRQLGQVPGSHADAGGPGRLTNCCHCCRRCSPRRWQPVYWRACSVSGAASCSCRRCSRLCWRRDTTKRSPSSSPRRRP